MTLNDLLKYPLEELLKACNVVSVKPFSDDTGKIVKIAVEYVPDKSAEKSVEFIKNWRD